MDNGSVLVTLKFNYIGGHTDLVWDNTPTTDCEYGAGPPDFSPYCDEPTASYYIDGSVSDAAMAAVIAVSPPLRLYVTQLFEQFRQWVFDLKELL